MCTRKWISHINSIFILTTNRIQNLSPSTREDGHVSPLTKGSHEKLHFLPKFHFDIGIRDEQDISIYR
jgi:hypothetical protein